ncbi:MAG: hypothetical protein AAGA03_14605 [Planctomycetota bacterium]
MSLHRDDYKSAAASHAEYFGDDVLYSDPITNQATVTASIHPEKTRRRRNSNGGYDLIKTRMVYVFTHGEKPLKHVREDGQFTIDGLTYAVESVNVQAGGRLGVTLVRSGRAEISRPNRRRRI